MRMLVSAIAVGLAAGAAFAQEAAVPQTPSMVFFDWGMTEIRTDDRAVLDEVAKAYHQHPGVRLQLAGYTDRSGSASTNRRSGLRRAEAVRAELAKRGVPASDMGITSHGEGRPLVPTEDGVREVQNRRVDISLVWEAGKAVGAAMPVPFPITGPNSEPRGFASFFSDGRRTVIKVEAEGLPYGVHGIHLHAVGRCDGPDFKSAGAHWNPAGKQHGHDNPQGAHLGDLRNLEAGADGRATASFTVDGDMGDADGTSLVIHAKPDDNKTDPSGNSGGRIACAVLVAAD